jgi:hypothetical protein
MKVAMRRVELFQRCALVIQRGVQRLTTVSMWDLNGVVRIWQVRRWTEELAQENEA